MFGFSIYLNQPLTDSKRVYIEEMAARGFQGIFTSLQIPEENSNEYKAYLTSLGAAARENHLELMVDISLESLSKAGFSLTNLEQVKAAGVTGLRIDGGINNQKIAELSQIMRVGLNASTITEEDILELQRSQADFQKIEAWHNYYPRPETGISAEFFAKKNAWLKELGLKTVAFVPGDVNLRQPLFEGLPTLEEHRKVTPLAGALDLFQLQTDSVYIGDEGLSQKAQEQFLMYQEEQKILLFVEEVQAGYEQWVLRSHVNRKDVARDVFRSEQARLWGIKHVEEENCVKRVRGSITMDNQSYGRYLGELQIVKNDLAADSRVNVIGKVCREDLPLLQHLGSAQEIEIRKNKERIEE